MTVLTDRGIIDQRVGNQAFVCSFFDQRIRTAPVTFRARHFCFTQAIPIAAIVKIILVLVTVYASGVFWTHLFLGKRLASPSRNQKSGPNQYRSNDRQK
jgi:hypothetical protein